MRFSSTPMNLLVTSLVGALAGCQLVAGTGDFDFDGADASSEVSDGASDGGGVGAPGGAGGNEDVGGGGEGGFCASGEGGGCPEKRALGDACTEDAACASGHCADGICCDGACDGTCVSCLGAQTGGASGSCLPVAANTDPAGECLMTDPVSCGASGAGCNGSFDAPGCTLWPAGTACAAQSCSDGVVDAATCDGRGTCNQQPPMSCGSYACADGGTACNATCNSDGDCAANAYCSGTSCVPKKQNGDGCTSGTECASGFCPGDDGVCCDGACDGDCEACLGSKTGGPNGTCAFVTNNTDPDMECGALTSCNGNGSCTL